MGNTASASASPAPIDSDMSDLPPTPLGWQPLTLKYHPAALPRLPHLSDESRARLDVVLGSDPIKRSSWNGDSALQHAATRVLVKAAAGLVSNSSRWVYSFRSTVLSNNVFSYLALSYGLISVQVAQTKTQKTSADLFEAYLGACDLERETMESTYEFTLFLRALFSETVWPALPVLVKVSACQSLSKQLADQAVRVLEGTWPGQRFGSRSLLGQGTNEPGDGYQLTLVWSNKGKKKKSKMAKGVSKVERARTERIRRKGTKRRQQRARAIRADGPGALGVVELWSEDEDSNWEDESADTQSDSSVRNEPRAAGRADGRPADSTRSKAATNRAKNRRVTHRTTKKTIEVIDLTMDSDDD